MMNRMYYISCDDCGTPAQEPVDTPEMALQLLPAGWTSESETRPRRKMHYCPTCSVARAKRGEMIQDPMTFEDSP